MKSAQRVLRRAPLSTLLCVLALVCMFILAVWAWLSSNQPSTETTSVTFASEGKTVVVILGGGVTSTGGVPEHTQRRLDIAYKLYQELGPTALFMPLSGGTPHKPNPLDAQGFPVWEATAAAQKLIEMGVPPEQILEESFSLDTIGNVSITSTPLVALFVSLHPA